MAEHKHSSVPEGFKEIPGYSGRYFINEQGQVWSTLRDRLLTQHLDSQKMYLIVLIGKCKGDTPRPKAIHRLMGLTWMGDPPGPIGRTRGKYCINHKDGNKMNNRLSNLEWVTVEDNTRHAWRNGLNTQVGETCTAAVLTSAKVREIRLRLVAGESPVRIFSEYGVGRNCIEKLRRYVSWRHQDHDLVVPMMQISNSASLKAFYDALIADQVSVAAYQEVEQAAPNGVVINATAHKNKSDYESWWYYSI